MEAGKRFAQTWVDPMPLMGAAPPAAEDCLAAATVARASAPVPDGMSFVAWAVAGVAGSETRAGPDEVLRRGAPVPGHSSDSLWSFIPKTEEEKTMRG